MSGRIVRQVLDHAPDDLSKPELLVLVALAEDAQDRDRTARYITLDDIAHRARLSPGRVRNLLSQLQQRCLIRGLHDARRGVRQVYVVADLGPEHRRSTWATVHELPDRDTPPDPRRKAAR